MKHLLVGLVLMAAFGSGAARAQSMVIATGVDPAFAAFYVANQAGIFKKNGLNVDLKTGPSGSTMASLVIGNQAQAAMSSEQGGIQNFNRSSDVVVVSEGTQMVGFHGLVARGHKTLDELKGKKIGVAKGTGGEAFWLAMLQNKGLKATDFQVVQVEAPEMIAALERGDIVGFAAWEPWLAKARRAVPNTVLVIDDVGIMSPRAFVYMNKPWVLKNGAAAETFLKSLMEASDIITKQPKEAAAYVAKQLNLDLDLTEELMPKVPSKFQLTQDSIKALQFAEGVLKEGGRLVKPVDYGKFIYPDLLKKLRPEAVSYEVPKS
ncbi:ABC transporter substrate-binding protein [Enterovirga aerilata]|uniref:ABC transporter substrate-binding protein n=1 Tax=Enterovirga aerilata TaxID=2730920 RepID=A0A849I486_9HYPH|nr:ABC transporter substrate-binding protein [Enterovirga sp. DB1703]NNM70877.1 ABC transporter substrate-binding protein [Enterovirga sp. DB1703]